MANNNFSSMQQIQDIGQASNENGAPLKQSAINSLNRRDSLVAVLNKLNALSEEINNEILQTSDYHFNIDPTSSDYIQLERYVELRDNYYELQKKFIRLQGNVLDQIPALRDILLSINSADMQFALKHINYLNEQLTRAENRHDRNRDRILTLENENTQLRQSVAKLNETIDTVQSRCRIAITTIIGGIIFIWMFVKSTTI